MMFKHIKNIVQEIVLIAANFFCDLSNCSSVMLLAPLLTLKQKEDYMYLGNHSFLFLKIKIILTLRLFNPFLLFQKSN